MGSRGVEAESHRPDGCEANVKSPAAQPGAAAGDCRDVGVRSPCRMSGAAAAAPNRQVSRSVRDRLRSGVGDADGLVPLRLAEPAGALTPLQRERLDDRGLRGVAAGRSGLDELIGGLLVLAVAQMAWRLR